MCQCNVILLLRSRLPVNSFSNSQLRTYSLRCNQLPIRFYYFILNSKLRTGSQLHTQFPIQFVYSFPIVNCEPAVNLTPSFRFNVLRISVSQLWTGSYFDNQLPIRLSYLIVKSKPRTDSQLHTHFPTQRFTLLQQVNCEPAANLQLTSKSVADSIFLLSAV